MKHIVSFMTMRMTFLLREIITNYPQNQVEATHTMQEFLYVSSVKHEAVNGFSYIIIFLTN